MISTDSILNVITTILALASGNVNFACLLFSWIASDTYIFGFMTFLNFKEIIHLFY